MSKDLKIVPPTPTPSISHWPTQKKVQQLADDLDGVLDANDEMNAAEERLSESLSSPDALRRARRAASWYESRFRGSVTSGRLQKLENECDPDSWWEDDDGDVRQPEVAKMVAKLVGSWPTSNIPEPGVFVRALIDDVMALNPSFVSFESACRNLRRKLKFMPSISEILAELESQQDVWVQRSTALEFIERNYQDLVKLVAKSEVAVAAAEEERERQRAAEEELRERQRKYWEAKAAPLVVGDRVRHKNVVGAGVITKPNETDCGDQIWYVLFDNYLEKGDLWVFAKHLEKLVEGDEGFVPQLPSTCVDARIEDDLG
jgi:hypothetical protein